MSKKTKTTALENELDQILASVDEQLAKSNLKKDDSAPEEDSAPEAAPEAPANEQPEAPAAEEAPAPEAAAAPAEEAPAAAAPGEEAPLQDESADQPLSDEELDQIYGSMAPEELQRHYMAMRAHLEAHAGAGEGAPDQNPAAAAPAAPAPEAPAPEQEQPLAASEDNMEKSEKSALSAAHAEIAELKKGLEIAVKTIQTIVQPERKSIAGVEFITKNEGEKAPANGQIRSDLTKSEIDEQYRKVGIANFTKAERETVNSFFLYDQGKDKVLDILKSKGGK